MRHRLKNEASDLARQELGNIDHEAVMKEMFLAGVRFAGGSSGTADRYLSDRGIPTVTIEVTNEEEE